MLSQTGIPKAHDAKGDNSKETALQSTAHHFQYAFEHVLSSVSKKDQAWYDRLRDRMARAQTLEVVVVMGPLTVEAKEIQVM